MTKEEFCSTYGYSLHTLKTSFNRTQQSMKNKGYLVTKTGQWPNTDYQVTFNNNFIPVKQKKLNTRLVGQVFGHLTVLEDTGKRSHRSIIWKCRCDCGREHEVTSNNLKSNRVNSCGNKNCQYHKTFENLKGKKFGLLTPLYPTSMKDGNHMYWMCQCDCGQQKEISSLHLKNGNIQSCGCIKKSIGENNIKQLLENNNISYAEQYTFSDLKNIKPLRFDFAIFYNNQLVRLIEFDGIQHYEEQKYFSHSLEEIQTNDNIKNEYAKNNNIPLVRIPYWERDTITIEKILGDEYLINGKKQ